MQNDLRNIDLNLFLHFDALLQERHVSRAASKMFLSQPAMSNALKRLRTLFNDPILVQTHYGMAPTRRALELQNPIREAIKLLQQSLQSSITFDPMTSNIRFVIHSIEEFEFVILPKLAAKFEKIAPHVTLVSEAIQPEIPEAGLTTGEISAILITEGSAVIPKRLTWQPFLEDKMVCLVREGNPNFDERMTLDEFSAATHVHHPSMLTPFAESTFDKWLQKNNIDIKYAVSTTAFMQAALILLETDYIMAVNHQLALMLAENMPVRIVNLPEDVPVLRHLLVWHPLHENSPSHKWLRRQLYELADEISCKSQNST